MHGRRPGTRGRRASNQIEDLQRAMAHQQQHLLLRLMIDPKQGRQVWHSVRHQTIRQRRVDL